MKINIDPKKKKIVIRYGLNDSMKKILQKGQTLIEGLPGYLVKILPHEKNKKDKESQDE
tara:strand:+ start:888 stop:1064 length:177 start_codon:yes stop_codon:yes gene_type:complete